VTSFLPGLGLDEHAGVQAPRTQDDLQAEMVEAVIQRRRSGHRSTVLQAPTGIGKTKMSRDYILRGVEEWGAKTLFLCHRRELVEQTEAEYRDAGIRYAVEMGDRKASDATFGYRGGVDVVIASIASLHEKRLQQWSPLTFTDVIVDECHLATNPSVWRAFDHFIGAKFRLGLSATPFRLDGKAIHSTAGAPFDSVAYRYTITQAITEGFLSPIVGVACQTGIDLKGVRVTRSRDFNVGDLEVRINHNIGLLVNHFRREIEKRDIGRAILFAPDVGSADAFSKAFCQVGLPSRAVWGNSPRHKMSDSERASIIRSYRDGELRVLCGCDVLTTGFNDRPSHVLMARPTKSLALYTQMLGRGTRKYPGVPIKYVIDCGWEGCDEVVTTPDVFLEDEPTPKLKSWVSRLHRKSPESNPLDLIEKARELAKREEEKEREEEERKSASKLRIKAKREELKCRVVEFSPVNAHHLLGLDMPVVRDLKLALVNPPTVAQREVLSSYGMTKVSGLDRDAAEKLVQECLDRDFQRLASPEQVRLLVKDQNVPIEQARKMSSSAAAAELSRPVRPTEKQRLWLQARGYKPEVIDRMSRQEASRIFVKITNGW
jgi:superfamily II DNA or RNA helicase